MTKITIRRGEGRLTLDADLHHGYLVEPGTHIPLLDVNALAELSEPLRKTIKEKLENARSHPELIAELWHQGEVLRYTLERPNHKFNYIDFLKKFQGRQFDSYPVEDALSPIERQYLLASVDLAVFKDQPSLVMNVFRSLPAHRMEDLLESNANTIAQFITNFGSATDLREFLELVPGQTRHKILIHDNYHLLLDAMSNNKQDMIDVFLEASTQGQQKGVPKDMLLTMVKQAVPAMHPSFNERVFLELLPVMLAACKAEGNTGAVEHAYKLAVLFSKPKVALNFLEKWTQGKHTGSRQPVHDILLFTLPNAKDEYDSYAWSKLATEYGPQALKYFGIAEVVETAMKELHSANPESYSKDLAAAHPRNLAIAAKMQNYVRAVENPDWASLCSDLNIPERVFDEGLEIFKKIKAKDNTPDIDIIDGASLGKPGYCMRKLPPTDPRNLLIGEMVQCCNHINGGQTGEMAKAHVTSPDAACYVIFKEERKGERNEDTDKPVAKLSGWMSKQNNFVFNSWERLSADYQPLCEPFLAEAAKRIFANDPTIRRVLLGRNRDGIIAFKKVTNPEYPRASNASSADSKDQYLIAERSLSAQLQAPFEQQKETQNSLKDAIIQEMVEMGLSPTQLAHLQKRLKRIEPEIDVIEDIARHCREMLKNERYIFNVQRDFLSQTWRPLESITSFIKKSGYYNYNDKYGAVAFIINMAIEHVLADVVPQEEKSEFRDYYCKLYDLEESKIAFARLGGRRSITEFAHEEPGKFAIRSGLLLTLLTGAGIGTNAVRQQINKDREKDNIANRLEQENPNIFRKVEELGWIQQFEDVDIGSVEKMRAKFGDTVEINDRNIPVEVFVEKVAPALNTLEEIRKETPLEKWNVKSPSGHHRSLEDKENKQIQR